MSVKKNPRCRHPQTADSIEIRSASCSTHGSTSMHADDAGSDRGGGAFRGNPGSTRHDHLGGLLKQPIASSDDRHFGNGVDNIDVRSAMRAASP